MPPAKKTAAKKAPVRQYLSQKALEDRRAKAKAAVQKGPTPMSAAAKKLKEKKLVNTRSSEKKQVGSLPSPDVESYDEYVDRMIEKDPYFLLDLDVTARRPQAVLKKNEK